MTPAQSPVIETERLILRAPHESDYPAFRAYRRSDRATRLVPVETEGLIWTLFAAYLGHWQLRGYGRFMILDRTSGATIGHAGPIFPEGWQEPELTWTIFDPAFEGRGLAFEAALAARAHLYRDLGWTTVVSNIAPGNDRSITLAERLGAVLERTDPGEVAPFHIYRHPGPEARA